MCSQGRDSQPGLYWCPADLDQRPHHPRQDIEARQSRQRVLFVQAAMGGSDQAQSWERYGLSRGIEAAKSGGTTTGSPSRLQQAQRPYAWAVSQTRSATRGHEDTCAFIPTCVSVAPCRERQGGPSKNAEQEHRKLRRTVLDVPCERCPQNRQARDAGTLTARNKDCNDQARAMK